MYFKKIISLLIAVCVGSLLFSPVFASNESCTPASPPNISRYIPIRLVAESLGYEVVWNNNDKTVDVFTIGGLHKAPDHVVRFTPKDYIIIGDRTYVPVQYILRLSNSESGISYIGDIGYYIYRHWVPIGTEGLSEELSMKRTIDNDSCQVVIYSDGDDQHPGGARTKRIRVFVQSRTF